MQNSLNQVYLRGRVAGNPAFSHESHGIETYSFFLAIKRLSGAEDMIRVLASGALLEAKPCRDGQPIEVEGSLRSFNNKSNVGSRLIITVLAREIGEGDEPDENQVSLSGTLCKPPIYRKTPLGREICDLILAVNRSYGRADYLPCIAWGAGARRCAACNVGDLLTLEGRIQSREYIKLVDNAQVRKTAFEVSVSQVVMGEV